MSATLVEMYATAQAILAAEIALVRISTPILFILGNIGEILNIIIFVQRNFRTNSCAIYFLAASAYNYFLSIPLFFSMVYLLVSLLTLDFTHDCCNYVGYNIDPSQTSLAFCKIKFYLSYIGAILPPSFIVLACLDRLMLSSFSARARSWSQPRVTYRLIIAVSVFWMLFSIHSLIGSNIYYASGIQYCYIEPGSYTLFVALYSIIIDYSLPPILMVIFGLLTIINVRREQRQTRPTAGTGNMQRKDRHLLRMLLFQLLINVIFTLPAGAYQSDRVVTADWQKDLVWQTWDLFFFVLVLFLFYIPNCAGFYIYTLTASIFRQELKRISIQYYR